LKGVAANIWEDLGGQMNTLCRQNSSVESAALEQETILFHSPTNRFYVLNSTSSFIWSRIKEPAAPNQIAEDLGRSFKGVTADDASRDVENTIQEMLALGLAEAAQ